MNYDWFLKNARLVTFHDSAVFRSAVSGLPQVGKCPYGSEAHNVQVFDIAQKISGAHEILEIGFNRGYGAAIWLRLGCSVTSVDLERDEEIECAAAILKTRYGKRFDYLSREDERLPESCIKIGAVRVASRYDLAFIDGNHELESVRKDIELCRDRLGIEWLLFDDFDPVHGPGVQGAIIESGLKMVALIGNMALCRESRSYEDLVPC